MKSYVKFYSGMGLRVSTLGYGFLGYHDKGPTDPPTPPHCHVSRKKQPVLFKGLLTSIIPQCLCFNSDLYLYSYSYFYVSIFRLTDCDSYLSLFVYLDVCLFSYWYSFLFLYLYLYIYSDIQFMFFFVFLGFFVVCWFCFTGAFVGLRGCLEIVDVKLQCLKPIFPQFKQTDMLKCTSWINMANVACVYLLQAIAVWKGLELLPFLLYFFSGFCCPRICLNTVG